jgi:predicted ATPase
MKLEAVHLERYRRFANESLSLRDKDGDILDLILLLGQNGAGKSSILQVIAATLATATGQLPHPSRLEWPGFHLETVASGYDDFASVRLDVVFSDDEISATQDFFRQSVYAQQEGAQPPEGRSRAQLSLGVNRRPQEGGSNYWVSAKGGMGVLRQFQGVRYAMNMLSQGKRQAGLFQRVGRVLWYDEQRRAYSLAPQPDAERPLSAEEGLRSQFAYWQVASPAKLDKFKSFYQRLFPRRRWQGFRALPGPQTPPELVFVDELGHEYTLAELSAGERAILPILIDFADWEISHSVILIDELELHLHPPLQQSLLMTLPELGQDNQFIITTHSEAVADLVPARCVRRIGS